MSTTAPRPVVERRALREPRVEVPLVLRLLAAPVTSVAVIAGLWLTGGVITNDVTWSMRLTVGWMAFAGLVALAIALRSHAFRWPVLGAFVVTAAAIGAWLGSSLNIGNQQYELGGDADLRRYTTVVIWCRAFSVLFARAPLQPAT